MNGYCSWRDLIPVEETEKVANSLVKTWHHISMALPDEVKYSKNEPKLTERLCYYLELFKINYGLTGFWINESQKAIYDDKGKLIDRIKKDITYLSNSSQKTLCLVFEFKKISKSSISAYRGKDGMSRFVDGNYALNKPLAVMVGILNGKDHSAISYLIKSLLNKKICNELNMIPDKDGQLVRCPSYIFPEVAHFDTEHFRAKEKLPPNGTISIAHIFLICVN